MVVKLLRPERAGNLFEGCSDTTLISCLQGVMGEVYGDDMEHPEAARAILGDFSFFGGKPTEELLLLFKDLEFHILVPGSEPWERLIESCLGGKVKRVFRYAIKKEPEIFDRERLREAAALLPAGYELRQIDEELYHQCLKERWSRDFVDNYPDYDAYRRLGLGMAVVKDGELAAGTSSYSSYHGGIEIEVGTKEPYRRRGLAYACSAGLILACLERGLYPSWDAQNLHSVGLAKKLGYHFDREYAVYEYYGRRE
ncbi:MAG: GNAT family N-acetyltransferase [Lachnospiraceae bacterium]|jgi:GNAT superfamily N-acetyltransferase|nr:GNAT family N-acetyltransferase [Lachnospiraceae bacterium]